MKKVSVLVAAFVMFAASPSFAVESSTEPTAPVKVECYVARSEASNPTLGGLTLTNGVTAKVTNLTSKTIKSITLYGTYAGQKITDTLPADIGPNSTMWFSKAYKQLPYEGPDVTCHVKEIDYTDGTTYHEPSKM
jgi:hypothetical protein